MTARSMMPATMRVIGVMSPIARIRSLIGSSFDFILTPFYLETERADSRKLSAVPTALSSLVIAV